MKGDEGLMGDDEDCGDVKVRKNREVLKVHEVHMSRGGRMQQLWQLKE